MALVQHRRTGSWSAFLTSLLSPGQSCRDAQVEVSPIYCHASVETDSESPVARLSKPVKRHIHFDPVAILLDAASNGETAVVKELLDGNNFLVSACNEDGVTALHCAAGFGHLSIVQLLLDIKGADVNVVDSDGWTPLHNAAAVGHLPMVKLLIEHLANVEAETQDGHRPDEVSQDPTVISMLKAERLRKQQASFVIALYDFVAEKGDELSIRKGDRLQVLGREEPGWWLVKSESSLVGLVPRQFVQ